ncbi:MAG: hypothetical protein ACI4K6_04980, partial [Candidatus Fimenecus sp.]
SQKYRQETENCGNGQNGAFVNMPLFGHCVDGSSLYGHINQQTQSKIVHKGKAEEKEKRQV